jgi:hypothetical protein
MAGLAEKLGFVVAPRFDGPFRMARNCSTASTPEMLFLGLRLPKKPAHQGQGNNSCDDDSDNTFV